MGAPVFTADDYLAACLSLFPRGRVWPKDPESVQARALAALMPTLERVSARASYLLIDGFPAQTFELLNEWELSLGLPDPCVGSDGATQQRRKQVVARFTDGGGQSVPYYIAFAAALGFTITISQFQPARVGSSRIGDPLYGEDWAHVWSVNAPLNTIIDAAVNEAAIGDPLRAWGNDVLECEFEAKTPAHTILQFRYS